MLTAWLVSGLGLIFRDKDNFERQPQVPGNHFIQNKCDQQGGWRALCREAMYKLTSSVILFCLGFRWFKLIRILDQSMIVRHGFSGWRSRVCQQAGTKRADAASSWWSPRILCHCVHPKVWPDVFYWPKIVHFTQWTVERWPLATFTFVVSRLMFLEPFIATIFSR